MKSSIARWLMGIVGAAFLTNGPAFSAVGQEAAAIQSTNTVSDEEICRTNLLKIYEAIQAYEKDHKDLPNWLSDLVPDYLADVNLLTCPVCKRTGKIESPPLADPKIAASYLFEFCPVPLGTTMAPRAPNKTRRDWKRRQVELLGPVVPLVRCRHHRPVLNLGCDGKIYESGTLWETLFTNKVSRAELSASRLVADVSQDSSAATLRKLEPPPRDANARKQLLDLTGFYNALLSDSWHGGTGNDLAALTPGLHTFGGVEFDVRGIIQLASKSSGSGRFPQKVKDIKVQQKCRRIHFLHSAGWGGVDDEGKQIGSYVVQFVDNQTRLEIPIYYGRNVRNWHFVPGEPPSPDDLTVVWSGENGVSKRAGRSLRLFMTSWTNLVPDMAIESIGFVSSLDRAAPFLIAITVDSLE